MNIFQVTRGYGKLTRNENPGALESVIYNLSVCLSLIGHNITIIDGGEYEQKKSVGNVLVSIVPINRVFLYRHRKIKIIRLMLGEMRFLVFGYKVSKYIKKIGIDKVDILHVHSTMVGISILMFNPMLASKMVYTSHVNIWSLNSKSLLEKMVLSLDILLMRRVKIVIALNSFLKYRYINLGKVSPHKIRIVNNGVDIKSFNIVDISIADKKYKLKDLNILFVGRFDKIKGIKYLLGAVNIIVNYRKNRDVLFILVGTHSTTTVNKSESINEIRSYIKAHNLENNVIITNYIPDSELKALYHICDTVIVPSLAEADPLVTLEAMAVGKPVIGSRVGGIPNQIIDHYNGLLVDPSNDVQIADRICYLLKNKDQLKIFGDNGKKRAEKYFSWEKVSNDLLVVYSNMR